MTTSAWRQIREMVPHWCLPVGDPGVPSDLAGVLSDSDSVRFQGNPTVLSEPRLAVVGTREPTPPVARLTRKVVAAAVESGFTLVSGLSPGVDCVVHQAAHRLLAPTIAVVAWGLDRPPTGIRRELAVECIAGGLLVSVFPDDATETAERRLYRNRVIAALCGALVLVASEPGGGAWDAREWAMRLARPVLSPIDTRGFEAD